MLFLTTRFLRRIDLIQVKYPFPFDSLIYYLVKCAFIPAGIFYLFFFIIYDDVLMDLLKKYRVKSSHLKRMKIWCFYCPREKIMTWYLSQYFFPLGSGNIISSHKRMWKCSIPFRFVDFFVWQNTGLSWMEFFLSKIC